MDEFQQSKNMDIEEKPKGGIAAAFIGAVVTIVSIGVLHMIAHANSDFKSFLNFHEGMGPLSGKIVISHILGFIVFGVAYWFLRKKQEIHIILWFILLIIALLLGSLFVFTPFVEWVA